MKRKFNADRTLALSAIFISLMSLILLVLQTSESRKHNRLSVQPRLSFIGHSYLSKKDATYGLSLINKGLGPAIIEKAYITYLGKEYDVNFTELIENLTPSLGPLIDNKETTSINEGTTIIPTEDVRLYELKVLAENSETFTHQIDSLQLLEIDVTVVYTSIYGERWKINHLSKNAYPEEL